MLTGYPEKVGWNCDANKAIFLHKNLSFRFDAVLEASPHPGIGVTRNIDSCSGDEIIPTSLSVAGSLYTMAAAYPYHEVRV